MAFTFSPSLGSAFEMRSIKVHNNVKWYIVVWRQRPSSPYFSSKCNTHREEASWLLRNCVNDKDSIRERWHAAVSKKPWRGKNKDLFWQGAHMAHKQAAIDQKGQKMWGMSLWKPTVSCLRRVWWKIHCLQQKLFQRKKITYCWLFVSLLLRPHE